MKDFRGSAKKTFFHALVQAVCRNCDILLVQEALAEELRHTSCPRSCRSFDLEAVFLREAAEMYHLDRMGSWTQESVRQRIPWIP